jgi:plastocyanin
MRKLLLLPVFVLALAAASPTSASDLTVRITAKGFDPASVSIQNGDRVVWKNTDTTSHQVVADDGSFKSGVLKPGEAYAHLFPSAGTFAYHGGINTSFRGTVNVKLTRYVLMNQSRLVTTYVQAVRLTGSISSVAADQQVTIESRPSGTDSFVEVARMTTSDGHWNVLVRPRRTTEYRAIWNNVSSQVHTVYVKPSLRLKQTGRTHFWAFVHADGVRYRRAVLQRWNRSRHVWKSLRSIRLTRLRTAPNQEYISSGSFYITLRHGTILRVRLSRAQAGPVMFGPAVSKPIRV